MKLTELTDKINFQSQGTAYELATSEQADSEYEVKDSIAYNFLLDILTLDRQSEYSLAVKGVQLVWTEVKQVKSTEVKSTEDKGTVKATKSKKQS